MCAKHLFSIEHRNRRWLANREDHAIARVGRKLAKVRRPSLLALMADIHREVDPIIQKNTQAYEHLFPGENTHARSKGQQLDVGLFRGRVFGTGDQSNGMEGNEPMWTNGQALKERDEVRE